MFSRLPHVIFFHWINQSFNAIVNYTNRSGTHKQDDRTLFLSYCGATTGALSCALSFNFLLKKWKNAPPSLARLVPFAAIAFANAINIPMMRNKLVDKIIFHSTSLLVFREFTNGIPVEDADGRTMGFSTVAPEYAIPQVVLSRVGMAVPNMVLGPVILEQLSKAAWYTPPMAAPLQTLLCGFMLAFSTPICCALFPQKSSIQVDHLELSLQEHINKLPNPPKVVYYNKGL